MKKLLSLILLITAILFVSCKEEVEFVKNKGEKRVQTLSYSFNDNQEEGIVSKTANVLDSVIINGSKILATETWKEGEEYFVASLIEESDPILTRANATQNVKGSDVYTFYSYGESTIKHQTITNTNKKFEVPVDEATNYGMIFLSTVDGTGLLNTSKLTIDEAKKEMTYNATFNENLCYKKFDKSTMPSTDAIDVEFTPVFSQLGISVPVDLAGVAEVTVEKITLSSGAQEKAAVTIKYDPTKKTSNITINDYEKLGDYGVDLITELNASKDATILKGGYYNVIPNGKNVSVYIEMSTDGGVYLSKKIDLKDNSGTPIKFKPGKRYKLTIDNKKFVNVEINPKEATIAIGGTQNFNLIANYVGGTSSDVTTLARWKSSSDKVAKVDAKGVVTGVGKGEATITASYLGKQLKAKVTVLDYTVVVAPATATIRSGQSVTLKATAKYSNGREEDVTSKATWSSDNNGVATVVNGKVVGGNPGSATITASYKVGNGPAKSGEATVTVLDYTVVVTPATATIISGANVNLTATAYYSDGTNENVTSKATWSSNNNGVATVVNGKVTGGNVGSATITAIYQEGTAPAKSGAATITTKLNLSIVVSPGSLSFAKGLSRTLTATAVYRNAFGTIVSQSVITPSWTSSNYGVASVNGSGGVYGAGQGYATIYASYGGATGSAGVTVTAPVYDPGRGLRVVGPGSIKVGTHGTFTAYAYLTDGSRATSGFSWNANRDGINGFSTSNVISVYAWKAQPFNYVQCWFGDAYQFVTLSTYN